MKRDLLTGFAAGFVLATAVILPLLAGGTILVTQGVNLATWDYCAALVAAYEDEVATEPGDLQDLLDIAPESTVFWTEANITTGDCTAGPTCATEVDRVCAITNKGSTGKSAGILLDSAGASYCAGQCVDGDVIIVKDCS